ncbi:hypothetical protein NS337_00675 [Pseudomonas oryzihabitans]|uniref:Minor tail T domain-containing protein n=1 Tax=Pseudomonas oryzihabitans TaxID=47885 RepID=A0ABX3IQX7_9PSED|nr:hypothetical protein NS337_00675 [Pseudomonas psychrotolerans]ONN70767.1 hypothetical protein BVL52_20695 [Pseudomonas psychrotolerans]
MLHGIGGRTILEAKNRLTYAEAMDWYVYLRRRGSLNLGNRLEHGFAMLATVLTRIHGGEVEMEAFMPYESALAQAEEDANGISIEKAMATWH